MACGLSNPAACGILLGQGSSWCLPELASEFFTTGPPGKSFSQVLFIMTGLCQVPAVGRTHLGATLCQSGLETQGEIDSVLSSEYQAQGSQCAGRTGTPYLTYF